MACFNVAESSTMLKRAENMDKLSLLVVDRLLDIRECFRLSQPLVKRDLSFKVNASSHPVKLMITMMMINEETICAFCLAFRCTGL